MRFSILFLAMLVSPIACAGEQHSIPGQLAQGGHSVAKVLLGNWVLKIQNPKHQLITTLHIKFAGEQGASCMAGNWKRVIVKSHTTTDEHFFPISEQLSYSLENGTLYIGRYAICDAYLQLSGKLRHSSASGEYVAFGLGGGSRLGYFSLTRSE